MENLYQRIFSNKNIEIGFEHGFTLVELLIVITLIIMLATVTVLNLSSYLRSRQLEGALNDFMAVVRDAQNRAITQEGGSGWGVHMFNSGGRGVYEVFSGLNFASGTPQRIYNLKPGFYFSGFLASSTYDLIFKPLSGQPVENKIISIASENSNSNVATAVFNSSGVITSHIETGLVGYWQFDENESSTVDDVSNYSNYGMLYNNSVICSNPPTAGCPIWQSASDCKSGHCLSFDGTNDFVSIATNNPANILKQRFGSITIEAWVYPTAYISGTFGSTIISNTDYDGWAMRLNNGYLFVDFRLSGGAKTQIISATQIPLNNWSHLALTYDGSVIKGYINGEIAGTLNASGIINSSANSSTCTFIGGEPAACTIQSGSEFPFPGRIDEVRVYGRALDTSEIFSHYNDLR